MKRMLLLTGMLSLLVVASGCSPISRNLQQKAEQGPNFEQVSADPLRFAGEIVIWGGYILENRAGEDRSRLTILQTPLSFYEAPKSKRTSMGRFIALADRRLEPEVYSEDVPVTVAGEIADFTQTLDAESDGAIPVLQVREIHVWKDPYDDWYYRRYRYGPYDPYGPYGPYDHWNWPGHRHFNEPFYPYRYR
ncbi:MAG: Slp family lipoprotein [Desulfohalobiaceae bacterium]|nr:Slp family lipoprotein [Desulfohalobiaceae bacterium]